MSWRDRRRVSNHSREEVDMTSPASANFPWSQIPEPAPGEIRRGRLPDLATSSPGGDYLAARGSRSGPSLVLLAGSGAGFAAIHGLFRLAEVLDARRLGGSLLIRIGENSAIPPTEPLLEPADALVAFEALRPGWRELPCAAYLNDPHGESLARRMAEASGLTYVYERSSANTAAEPTAWMAEQGRPAVRLRIPDAVDERPEAAEQVFQGLINILRVLDMLEGQLAPTASVRLQQPAYAQAPAAGYWTPIAKPGQRLRINDRLGSFRDGQGNELGNLLTNISGILLGISDEIWVEPGQPLAELARPAG